MATKNTAVCHVQAIQVSPIACLPALVVYASFTSPGGEVGMRQHSG
jgi:hypothetical protein